MTETVTNVVQFKCYSCRADCAAGYTLDDQPAVFHAMPMCSVYKAIDSPQDYIAFLRRCRESY